MFCGEEFNGWQNGTCPLPTYTGAPWDVYTIEPSFDGPLKQWERFITLRLASSVNSRLRNDFVWPGGSYDKGEVVPLMEFDHAGAFLPGGRGALSAELDRNFSGPRWRDDVDSADFEISGAGGTDSQVFSIRECFHPGQPRYILMAFAFGDSTFNLIWRVEINEADLNSPTEVRARGNPAWSKVEASQGGLIEHNPALGFCSGAEGVFFQSFTSTTRHVRAFVGMPESGVWHSTQIKSYDVEYLSTVGNSADRNHYAAGCLNDVPRCLAYNHSEKKLYRILWEDLDPAVGTPQQPVADDYVAVWELGHSEIETELPISSTTSDRYFDCYSRTRGRDTALVGSELVTNGHDSIIHPLATGYYDSDAGDVVPIHPDDLSSGRNPTYLHVGPDGEIVYGSSKFVRRVAGTSGPGWLLLAEAIPVNTDVSLAFNISSNKNFYHIGAFHGDLRQTTGLVGAEVNNPRLALGAWLSPSWELSNQWVYGPSPVAFDEFYPSYDLRSDGTNFLALKWSISRDGEILTPHRQLVVPSGYDEATVATTGLSSLNGIPTDTDVGMPFSGPSAYEWRVGLDLSSTTFESQLTFASEGFDSITPTLNPCLQYPASNLRPEEAPTLGDY